MTPERLEMLRASLRKRDAMPDADIVLEAQPHDMEELFRLARVGIDAEEFWRTPVVQVAREELAEKYPPKEHP
jgi:hypothetical protein